MIKLIQNQNESKNSQYCCVVRVVSFVKISICDALFQINDDAELRYHALPQEIRTIKLSGNTKSSTADHFILKKHRKQR